MAKFIEGAFRVRKDAVKAIESVGCDPEEYDFTRSVDDMGNATWSAIVKPEFWEAPETQAPSDAEAEAAEPEIDEEVEPAPVFLTFSDRVEIGVSDAEAEAPSSTKHPVYRVVFSAPGKSGAEAMTSIGQLIAHAATLGLTLRSMGSGEATEKSSGNGGGSRKREDLTEAEKRVAEAMSSGAGLTRAEWHDMLGWKTKHGNEPLRRIAALVGREFETYNRNGELRGRFVAANANAQLANAAD